MMCPVRKELAPRNIITELMERINQLERDVRLLRIAQQNPTVPSFIWTSIRVSPIEGQIFYTSDDGKLNVWYNGTRNVVQLT
jgi:hypothetical protein